MRDDMQYDPIQGQGHMPFKNGNHSIFKSSHLLCMSVPISNYFKFVIILNRFPLICQEPPCWPGQSPSAYSFASPLPHLLLYLLVSFTFPFLTRFIYFLAFPFLPFYQNSSTPFQARCRRRRLNLGLIFYVLILCYRYFLVKDACLFLLYLISFVLRCDSCLLCCRC